MNHQDLINTCIFERYQGLLFFYLSGPKHRPTNDNLVKHLYNKRVITPFQG